MALNFPNSPVLNDVYTDSVSGFSYQWNGTVWISFSAASSSQIKIIDDISGSFNGIGKTFALAITGSSISPPSPQSLLITLGGVTQKPVVDYTISTSNIVFNEAPEAALAFSGISLGPAIPLTTIPSGTVTAGSLTVAGLLSTTNLFVTGIATASSFVGALTGNATGLSGTPNITVGNIVASAGTFTNLTVNGTQTIINTTSLEISDKNIGIGSTSSPSDALADGAGITIYGTTNKTITWENDIGCFEYNQPSKFRGVIETVSTGTTYALSGGNVVLELDVRNATTYTHSLSNGSVGIVSFKNMPADTGVSNGTTITVIFTQNATGTANTTTATGIGTNCFVIGFEDGATVAGISTRALVGSATTVTLSTTASDRDFVSFFVHYTGGTNTTASSYQVYATKNGGFRQGTVGV